MPELTKHEIEQSLEADRQALAQSIVALRDQFSPAALLADGKEMVRAQAGPLLARLDGAVRAQPVAAAVAGLALAALFLGQRRRAEAEPVAPALAGTRYEAMMRWEDEGGPPAPVPPDLDEEWLTEAIGLREKARMMLWRLDEAARRKLAPTAQLAADRAAVLAALGRDTTRALGRGLEQMAGDVREQAILSRERIYLHRIAATDRARDVIESHPLATGAAIAAVGATVACLFPPTETEDALMGEASDWLADDLKRTTRDEVMRASEFARTLVGALRKDVAAIAATPARPSSALSDDTRRWRH